MPRPTVPDDPVASTSSGREMIRTIGERLPSRDEAEAVSDDPRSSRSADPGVGFRSEESLITPSYARFRAV